jgi:hypothetical protein
MDGRGQERYEEEHLGCGRQGEWFSERTSGGADRPQGSGSAALIEVVFRKGLGVGGIEPGGPGDSLATERVSRRLAGAQRRQPGGLVEVVGEGLLGDLFCLPTVGPHGELGLGWAPGGVDQRGRSGLSDMGQDLCDGLGLGEERDKGERFLAGGTDQREDFIDPSQKSGPPGWPGGGGIRCPPLCPLWLGSRGRGGCRERTGGTGKLNEESVVLLGPFGDERSQGRIGGEDPMVAVAMNAGGREDRGQAIQETERSGVRRRGSGGRAARGGNSRPSRSVASMRTLASRLNPGALEVSKSHRLVAGLASRRRATHRCNPR